MSPQILALCWSLETWAPSSQRGRAQAGSWREGRRQSLGNVFMKKVKVSSLGPGLPSWHWTLREVRVLLTIWQPVRGDGLPVGTICKDKSAKESKRLLSPGRRKPPPASRSRSPRCRTASRSPLKSWEEIGARTWDQSGWILHDPSTPRIRCCWKTNGNSRLPDKLPPEGEPVFMLSSESIKQETWDHSCTPSTSIVVFRHISIKDYFVDFVHGQSSLRGRIYRLEGHSPHLLTGIFLQQFQRQNCDVPSLYGRNPQSSLRQAAKETAFIFLQFSGCKVLQSLSDRAQIMNA